MSGTLTILAAGEDPTVKIVVGVVIAVGWLITQVIGALAKKPEKRVPPGRTPPAPRPRPTARPSAQYPGPQPVPPMPPRQGRPPQRPTLQKKPPLVRPPLSRPTPLSTAISDPVPAARPASAVRTEANLVSAAAPALPKKAMRRDAGVRGLIKRQSLKKAIVLAEILQPPVALRAPTPDRD